MMSSKLVYTFFLVPAVAQRKCEARLDRLMGRRCLRSGSTAVVKHVKVQSTPGMLLKVVFSTFAGLPAAALPHFKSWTIAARLIAIVIALALPLNVVVIAVIWNLNSAANEAQRASLLYSARSVAAAVDAELFKYIALVQTLSGSPALLDDNLDAFDAEARRAFAPIKDASFLVTDLNGQHLINGPAQRDQPLPRQQPVAMRAQNLALENPSAVCSDILLGHFSTHTPASASIPFCTT